MLTFQRRYFLFTLLLFCIEVAIALFLHDRFVRPYVGDYLAVILLYCFFRSFLNVSATKLAVAVLLFACALEAAQFFRLAQRLQLQKHPLLLVVIGSSAEWSDVLAYALGIGTVLFLERNK